MSKMPDLRHWWTSLCHSNCIVYLQRHTLKSTVLNIARDRVLRHCCIAQRHAVEQLRHDTAASLQWGKNGDDTINRIYHHCEV